MFGSAAPTITAPTSASGGAITYTSGTPATATITSAGVISLVGVGTTTITATQAASGNYVGTSTVITLTVNALDLTGIGPISGSPTVGSTLTAGALTPSGATVSYEWQSSVDQNTFTLIPNATSTTYTVAIDDQGKSYRVVAKGTGNYTGTKSNITTVVPKVVRGDRVLGGIVVYVNPNNSLVNPSTSKVNHGLIAANADIPNVSWQEALDKCTEMAYLGPPSSRWYLPSLDDLQELQYRDSTDVFHAQGFEWYWSSNEAGENAYAFPRDPEAEFIILHQKYLHKNARPVRKF